MENIKRYVIKYDTGYWFFISALLYWTEEIPSYFFFADCFYDEQVLNFVHLFCIC